MIDKSKHQESKSALVLALGLVVIIFASIAMGIAGIATGNIIKNGILVQNSNVSDLGKKCTNEGGIWQNNTKECERVSEPFCRSLGGVFDACASPCRNGSGEVMCIQMCVQVCSFK